MEKYDASLIQVPRAYFVPYSEPDQAEIDKMIEKALEPSELEKKLEAAINDWEYYL